MDKINLNGQLLPIDQPIFTAQSRPFKYGDSLFETMRLLNGELPFIDKHFNRLTGSMSFLKLEIPSNFSIVFLKNEIQKLTQSIKNARIRITVFRENGGLYTPQGNASQFLIEAKEIQEDYFTLNYKGLVIDLCLNIRLERNQLSNLKTGNSLPYILAALYKKDHQLDDCILLNNKDRIVEASSSNIFLIKDKRIYTPRLKEGGIAGVMRQEFIDELAPVLGITVKESKISIPQLAKADEVFLTNAVQGIRWVKQFRQHTYNHEITPLLLNALNDYCINLALKK